jgi:hypothetical protein
MISTCLANKGTYNFGKGESCKDSPSQLNAQAAVPCTLMPSAGDLANTCETIFKCFNPVACLGRLDASNALGDCAEDYSGTAQTLSQVTQ